MARLLAVLETLKASMNELDLKWVLVLHSKNAAIVTASSTQCKKTFLMKILLPDPKQPTRDSAWELPQIAPNEETKNDLKVTYGINH